MYENAEKTQTKHNTIYVCSWVQTVWDFRVHINYSCTVGGDITSVLTHCSIYSTESSTSNLFFFVNFPFVFTCQFRLSPLICPHLVFYYYFIWWSGCTCTNCAVRTNKIIHTLHTYSFVMAVLQSSLGQEPHLWIVCNTNAVTSARAHKSIKFCHVIHVHFLLLFRLRRLSMAKFVYVLASNIYKRPYFFMYPLRSPIQRWMNKSRAAFLFASFLPN